MRRMPSPLCWLPMVAVVALSLLMGGSQCVKRRDRTRDFTVEQQADLSHLAVVAAARRYLLGIDTATFQVKARIRCDEMQFDKLARLPDGGVLVVDESSRHPRHLYRFNPDCSLHSTIPTEGSATTPFVHGDLLLVGSRGRGKKGAPVDIYRLNGFAYRKTVEVPGMLLRQEYFSAQGDRIFFPYDATRKLHGKGESFPVMLDAKTLETTHLSEGFPTDKMRVGPFVSAVRGDSLFVLQGGMLIIYDLSARRTLAYCDHTAEVESRVGNIDGIARQPVLHDGTISALYAGDGKTKNRAICWIQIRLSDLSLVGVKQVLEDYGAWYAGDDFHTFGRFYVIEANMKASKTFTATFIDWRTGEVVGECTLKDLIFDYF